MYYHDDGADASGRCAGAPGLRSSLLDSIRGGTGYLKGVTECSCDKW